MIAGKLNSRITVYEPVSSVNELGEREASWKNAGTWHAQRVLLAGSRTDEADEMFPDYRARYIVRIEHKPQPGWRLDGDDGLLYEIVSAVPNRQRGMLTLDCQRVNQ